MFQGGDRDSKSPCGRFDSCPVCQKEKIMGTEIFTPRTTRENLRRNLLKKLKALRKRKGGSTFELKKKKGRAVSEIKDETLVHKI